MHEIKLFWKVLLKRSLLKEDEYAHFKRRYYIYLGLTILVTPIIFLKLLFSILHLIFDMSSSSLVFDFTAITYSSLLWGTLYLSLAIGLTLGYKIFKFPNFAIGELFLIGGYTAVYLGNSRYFLSSTNDPNSIVLFAAAIAGFFVSGFFLVVIDWIIFRPLRKRDARPQTFMIASLGVALSLRAFLALRFGSRTYTLPTAQADWPALQIPTLIIRIPLQNEWMSVTIFRRGSLALQAVKILDVMIIAILAAVVIGFFVFLKITKLGVAMRAVASNPDLAASSGINVERIYTLTSFIMGGIAGIGGAFYASKFPIDLADAIFLIIPAFAALVLGSVGSLGGGLIASYIVGFSRVFSEPFLTALTPPTNRSNLLAYNQVIPFFVLIAVLLFYTQGIGEGIENWFNRFSFKREPKSLERMEGDT